MALVSQHHFLSLFGHPLSVFSIYSGAGREWSVVAGLRYCDHVSPKCHIKCKQVTIVSNSTLIHQRVFMILDSDILELLLSVALVLVVSMCY